MNRLLSTGLFTLIVFAQIQLSAQDIYVQGGAENTVQVNNEVSFGAQLIQMPEHNGVLYGIVSLKNIPTAVEKQDLVNSGIELNGYLPVKNFYVRIPDPSKVVYNSMISALTPLVSTNRLSDRLQNPPYPDYALDGNHINVRIELISSLDEGVLIEYLHLLGGEVDKIDEYTGIFHANLPQHNLRKLASFAPVAFIESIDAPGEPENYKARGSHRVNSVSKIYTGLPQELDGSGMNVMIQDDGFIGPHIDFQGRIGDQWVTRDAGDHGDHCAGTILGSGNLNPVHTGMAPGANLWVYDAAGQGYPGFDSIYNHYNDYDIRITSTSYSNGTNAGYTFLAQKLDDQVERMPDLIHVFSAGNAGSGYYTITGGHKVAKNVVTVANLNSADQANSSSSRGPARDGRIKPDIGAVGTQVISTSNDNQYVTKTGTSMSCPGVAGTITVLSQAYKSYNSGSYPELPLIKGVICNSADDLGREGPDFIYGFGRINARKAFDVIKAKSYATGSVSNGDSVSFNVSVPNGTSQMKIMLIWADPKGSIGSTRPLVNDLDVTAVSSGVNYQPYVLNPSSPTAPATFGRDDINNMEQIVIDGPTGSVDVKVKGHTVASGPQKFYVIYTYETDGIIVEYPSGGESWAPGERETIRWSAPANAGPFRIEYSTNGGSSWSTIGNNVTNSYYDWNVNNTVTNNALIRVSDAGGSGQSRAAFDVIGVPGTPFIIHSCPDSATLQWSSVTGAKEYIVYRLGEKYMDSIGVTTANNFGISENCIGYSENWYAVSAIGQNGERGRRSEAYFKTSTLVNCNLQNDLEPVEVKPDLNLVKSCGFPGGVRAKVVIKNAGASASSPFVVNVTVNGGTAITENYNSAIPPGDEVEVQMTSALNLIPGKNDIEVWVSYLSDENSCNDTLRVTSNYEVAQELFGCSVTDFDNFSNCDINNNCEEGECELMDGWSNLKNGEGDDIDWRTHNGSTRTNSTGPSADHTFGNIIGKYIYLEASFGNVGCVQSEAVLISPCYDLSTATKPELSFWYHMYGSQMGSLDLDILVDGEWQPAMTRINGNQGNTWTEKVIDLTAHIGKVVQFRFTGITGTGFRSDMALDDIAIKDTVSADFSYTNTNFNVDFSNLSSGATDVVWYFGDGDTSSQRNPQHTYANDGSYTVKLVVESSCGTDSIEREINVVSSVAEYANAYELNVYPVPADHSVNIRADKNFNAIRILDLSGKEVINLVDIESSEVVIDISALQNGVYVMVISGEEGISREKLEIMHTK